MKVKYILHLARLHLLNVGVLAVVAIALSKYGWVDALCLSLVFTINFYDHIKAHHRYRDFVREQKREQQKNENNAE